MDSMFCFQCEQVAGGKSCSGKQGVCGKPADVSDLQDKLTGELIGLSFAVEQYGSTPVIDQLVIGGLFTTVTNVNFNDKTVQELIDRVVEERNKLAGGKGYNTYKGFDLEELWAHKNEDIRSLKSLILFGLRGTAAYAEHAYTLGYTSDRVTQFFYEGLRAVGSDLGMEELLPLTLKVGEVNLECMALLDAAHNDTYGVPTPATVPMEIEAGPFIVISGHDLHDLQLLLEQTEGKGINIYTHSEMLPAHGYPELKKYNHLKGNFGTAWQNQRVEFDNIPAPVLFTTNCLMPPKDNYKDRVFTTQLVSYPELVHIDDNKDFTPVIEKALELGGYAENTVKPGINGGTTVTTGFGHGTVLGAAEAIVEGVKKGEVKHFFLVGGCDGAKPGRNYYTDFVKQTPKDSFILTVACGKYRFNDLNVGELLGLPRILDMGQCNDAYGAVRVALALAEVFECGVNDLPLSLVLSWYEQKAVCILLTLLHLGIKNILLGPTLPAFVSPNVLDFLVENFGIAPISRPEDDLKRILG